MHYSQLNPAYSLTCPASPRGPVPEKQVPKSGGGCVSAREEHADGSMTVTCDGYSLGFPVGFDPMLAHCITHAKRAYAQGSGVVASTALEYLIYDAPELVRDRIRAAVVEISSLSSVRGRADAVRRGLRIEVLVDELYPKIENMVVGACVDGDDLPLVSVLSWFDSLWVIEGCERHSIYIRRLTTAIIRNMLDPKGVYYAE